MNASHIVRVLGAAIALATMLWALLIGPTGIPSAQADPCPNVEVTFARGTSQQPGVGNVGQAFIDSLRSQIGGRSLGVYAVNYPGTFQFAQSAPIGANDVNSHVQDMVGRCPNTKLVLGGMSQGAGVIDMASTMIPPEAADHVAAVALFGNPKSMLATTLSGGFPDISPLFAAKTIDMCAPDDPACSGGMNPQAHGSYVESGMAAQAATFAAGRL
jgi:cutinase